MIGMYDSRDSMMERSSRVGADGRRNMRAVQSGDDEDESKLATTADG